MRRQKINFWNKDAKLRFAQPFLVKKKLDQLIGHPPGKVKFGSKAACGCLASLRCGSNFKYSQIFSYLTFQISSDLKLIFGGFGVKQIMAFVCILRRIIRASSHNGASSIWIDSESLNFFLISSVQNSFSQLLRNAFFLWLTSFFPRDEIQLFLRLNLLLKIQMRLLQCLIQFGCKTDFFWILGT